MSIVDQDRLYTHCMKLFNRLEEVLNEGVILFDTTNPLARELREYNIYPTMLLHAVEHSLIALRKLIKQLNNSRDDLIGYVSRFLKMEYGTVRDLANMMIMQLVYHTRRAGTVMTITRQHAHIRAAYEFYMVIEFNYKSIKDMLNKNKQENYSRNEKIIVDATTPLWDSANMVYHEYPSDFSRIRDYTKEIVDTAPLESATNMVLLHEMVSELIKNAIKHGNKLNPQLKVKIWHQFTPDYFKIIVEDQGEGFQNIEDWNTFNRKRNRALREQDIEKMLTLINYHHAGSSEDDGGNALISALEYWDSGLIFNKKRNKVVAVKYFDSEADF